MSRSLTFAARGVLVALFAGCILFQVALPQLAYDLGGEFVETKHLVVPYAVTEIVAVLFAEAVVVLTGFLVSRIREGRMFSTVSRRLVRSIYVLIVVGVVVAVLPPLHLLVVVNVGGPGIALATIAFVAVGLGVALAAKLLLATILRGETIETELEGVI